MIKRIISYLTLLLLLFPGCTSQDKAMIMTVNGPISPDELGMTLTHEHLLVDFIGADSIDNSRWVRSEVVKVCLPYLKEISDRGFKSFAECTPAWLGRDPLLLKELSDLSGMHIITNTGYYGAVNNKYLPQSAYDESAEELARRWISEWENGIEGSGVKPGFIKIGVERRELSDIHRKLVSAAAKTHLMTGLTIASHTGLAVPAFQELEILNDEGVSPEAFIWVHAHNEKDFSQHVKAAKMGAWISFDAVNENNIEEFVSMIKNMKDNNLLNKVLLSHDAGWYTPGEENGGSYRGYTTLYDKLVPALKEDGFSDDDINQLLVKNPAEAFTVEVHKVN